MDAASHGSADVYEAPTCAVADGLAVDGLSRPFVSLAGRSQPGVYELGYKVLHLVVPDYALLGVSPVGDMLVGPRIDAPTGPADGASPVLRTLLVWQGIGGPTVIGTPDPRPPGRAVPGLVARRRPGGGPRHARAPFGASGSSTSSRGRGAAARFAWRPALPPQVSSVGAAFAAERAVRHRRGEALRDRPGGGSARSTCRTAPRRRRGRSSGSTAEARAAPGANDDRAAARTPFPALRHTPAGWT